MKIETILPILKTFINKEQIDSFKDKIKQDIKEVEALAGGKLMLAITQECEDFYITAYSINKDENASILHYKKIDNIESVVNIFEDIKIRIEAVKILKNEIPTNTIRRSEPNAGATDSEPTDDGYDTTEPKAFG